MTEFEAVKLKAGDKVTRVTPSGTEIGFISATTPFSVKVWWGLSSSQWIERNNMATLQPHKELNYVTSNKSRSRR